MRRSSLLLVALLLHGLAGCGGGTQEIVPEMQPDKDTTATQRDGAAAFLGDWELRGDPPQRPPGFSLTITVDSAAESHYFGRLTHYFAGNVGRDPREFEAFRDSVRTDGVVSLVIPTVDLDMLGIVMEGSVTAADTIQLSLFVLGPDTLSSGTRRWTLVKER